MDPETVDRLVASYYRCERHSVPPPDTPRVSVELAPGCRLSEDTALIVLITIRRLDDDERSCVLDWSIHHEPFTPLGPLLFRHDNSKQKNGCLQPLDMHTSGPPTTLQQHRLWELPPRGSSRGKVIFSSVYRTQMEAGETYEAVWPSGLAANWAWGTLAEHGGRTKLMQPDNHLPAKQPAIIIPGSRLSVYMNKAAPSPQPSPTLPILPLEWIHGAPVLRMVLSCDHPEMPLHSSIEIHIRVVYDAPPGSQPIVFHTLNLLEAFQMFYGGITSGTSEEDAWRIFEDDGTGFMIVDEPDVAVHVARHEEFTSLEPGAVWEHTRDLISHPAGMGWLPDDLEAGHRVRYTFTGTAVDWWDWGSKEEHADTVVKLPCFVKGRVQDPRDNGGRPTLVVPASNTIEFRVT